MNLNEQKKQFYRQFVDTGMNGYNAWCADPANTFEILRDPWKAEKPSITVSEGGRSAEEILKMLRERQAAGQSQPYQQPQAASYD